MRIIRIEIQECTEFNEPFYHIILEIETEQGEILSVDGYGRTPELAKADALLHNFRIYNLHRMDYYVY